MTDTPKTHTRRDTVAILVHEWWSGFINRAVGSVIYPYVTGGAMDRSNPLSLNLHKALSNWTDIAGQPFLELGADQRADLYVIADDILNALPPEEAPPSKEEADHAHDVAVALWRVRNHLSSEGLTISTENKLLGLTSNIIIKDVLDALLAEGWAFQRRFFPFLPPGDTSGASHIEFRRRTLKRPEEGKAVSPGNPVPPIETPEEVRAVTPDEAEAAYRAHLTPRIAHAVQTISSRLRLGILEFSTAMDSGKLLPADIRQRVIEEFRAATWVVEIGCETSQTSGGVGFTGHELWTFSRGEKVEAAEEVDPIERGARGIMARVSKGQSVFRVGFDLTGVRTADDFMRLAAALTGRGYRVDSQTHGLAPWVKAGEFARITMTEE